MFDVAVGERAISHVGHIKMMGAVQPFLSGAISKTVNMPQTATVEDIADAYIQAWRLGVKALAIYRDGSKTAQALRTDAQDTRSERERPARAVHGGGGRRARRRGGRGGGVGRDRRKAQGDVGPARRRMPRERQSITHKFSLGGHEGYITAGMYEDGTVGEIFLTDIGKEGSTLRGMMNSFATAISIALQYGVPLETLVRKFAYVRFEPEGITTNPEIPFAKSMPDYIMRWLASRFLDTDTQEELGILTPAVRAKMEDRTWPSAPRRRHAPVQRRRPTAAAVSRPTGSAPGTTSPAPRSIRCRPRRPDRRDDGHPAGRPGQDRRLGPRPGLPAVRRHHAAHGLVLHVPQLRQQHRLRLSFRCIASDSKGAWWRPSSLYEALLWLARRHVLPEQRTQACAQALREAVPRAAIGPSGSCPSRTPPSLSGPVGAAIGNRLGHLLIGRRDLRPSVPRTRAGLPPTPAGGPGSTIAAPPNGFARRTRASAAPSRPPDGRRARPLELHRRGVTARSAIFRRRGSSLNGHT